MTKKTRLARVTIRQDINRPQTPLPYPVLLIGTTSSFHFFYDPESKPDGNEQVFIVPTSNIASLEFNPLKAPEKSEDGLSQVAAAIKDLNIGARNHCASGWKKLIAIQSFPEAEHALDGSRLTELSTELESLFKDKTLQQLMLIGRADIKPLGVQRLQAYGSNNGLAQARAKWVWEKLKKELKVKIDPQRVILLSAGPLHVGKIPDDEVEGVLDPDEKKRAEDRSVEIHACWAPKPVESAESTP